MNRTKERHGTDMKGIMKRMAGTFAIITLFGLLFAENAYAAGSVSITASTQGIGISEEVTVNIKAENPEGSAEKPQISVEYDAAVLNFVSCDKSYGGGGGGLITLTDTEAQIVFSGVAAGETKVSVSAVLDGDGADVPTGEVAISVGTADEIAAAGGATGSVSGDAAGTGIAEGLIAVGDSTKMLSTTFPNEIMPSGFQKTAFTYHEQMVEAAQFGMGNLTLLYLTDESGANGGFSIYDQATDTFNDFVYIQGIEGRYIVIMKADETVTIPEGFTKATLQWDNKTLEAYMIQGSNAAAGSEASQGETTADGISTSDFFLLYGLSSEGKTGWYMYDRLEGTYQRYLNLGVKSNEGGSLIDVLVSPKSTGEGGTDAKFIIICVMSVVMLILLVVLVIFFLAIRDYQSYEYIDEDEDEDEEDEGKSNNNIRNSGNRNNYSGIGYGGNRGMIEPDKPIMTADEMRAKRYEAGEELGDTGEMYMEDLSEPTPKTIPNAAPTPKPASIPTTSSSIGYETADMSFEEIEPLPPLPAEEEPMPEPKRGRKAKKEKRKSRLAQWYEDDDFADDDMDDEDDVGDDDMDDDSYDVEEEPSTKKKGLFGRKKVEPLAEAEQVDWSQMQSELHVKDPDDRRPTTAKNRIPVSTPQMTVTEPPKPPQPRMIARPQAPISQPQMQQPQMQQSTQQPQVQQPQMHQPQPQVEPMTGQPITQQAVPYMQDSQFRQQQPRQSGQAYYEPQASQPSGQAYYEPQTPQPSGQAYYEPQAPQPQPKYDIDDDFEFEFIKL